jgi:hypothetical protein
LTEKAAQKNKVMAKKILRVEKLPEKIIWTLSKRTQERRGSQNKIVKKGKKVRATRVS